MTKDEVKREQEWQAMEDARTMAIYQEIMSDKARIGRAIKVAKKQASELQKRANTMSKVAKSTKKTLKKGNKDKR